MPKLTPEQMKVIFDKVNAILQMNTKKLEDEVIKLRQEYIAKHGFYAKWNNTLQDTVKFYCN